MPRTLASIIVSALFFAACSTQSFSKPETAAPPSADRVQACAELKQAIAAELAQLTACENDSQCGMPVPSAGSCGCTRGPVARLDADTTKYKALLDRLSEFSEVPGCESRLGMCDCPEMDGAMCGEQKRCVWKPLDRSTLCGRAVDSYVGKRKRECPEGVTECPATLVLNVGIVDLTLEGTTLRSNYQCRDGNLSFENPQLLSGNIAADGTLSMFDDVFTPAPGARELPGPAPAEDYGQRSEFMPASGEINCTYTGKGGIDVYMPANGGPEIVCDRSVGHVYERVALYAEGPGRIATHPNERSCCSIHPVLLQGERIVRGPFTCELKAGEIACKRADGHGVAIGGKRARVLRP